MQSTNLPSLPLDLEGQLDLVHPAQRRYKREIEQLKALFPCSLASYPGLHHYRLHEKCGEPCNFSHVCDVKCRNVVERTWSLGAMGLRTARRAKVTYHTYLASGGQLLYALNIGLVVR